MSRGLRALLLPLVLVACGAPPAPVEELVYSPCAPVRLAPEADTTDAERESIARAVALWREVGLRALTLAPPSEPTEGAIPLRFQDAALIFRGVYEPSSGLVSINRKLTGDERVITVAHELGHALGLPHVPAATRSSVMNPGNLEVLPTAQDFEALQRRWGCPL